MSADAAEPERGSASSEPTQPGTEPERNAADERDAVLVPRDEDLEQSDRQMWAFKQLIELERQRVDSNNRRTDVAVKAIAASDASDKRQYEYHVEKLRQGADERKGRHGSAVKFAWAVFALAVVSGAFVVGMLFFGNDSQRDAAETLLRTIGTAVGGAGAFWLAKEAFQRVFAAKSPDQ